MSRADSGGAWDRGRIAPDPGPSAASSVRPFSGSPAMRLSVPKETAPGESRVALVPESCRKLGQSGYQVFLEAGAGIEAGLTCGLLLTVFLMLSSTRTARWAPAAVTGVLAALIWAGAPHTGASMNPARSFGPALASGTWDHFWIWVVGPVVGTSVGALAYQVVRGESV